LPRTRAPSLAALAEVAEVSAVAAVAGVAEVAEAVDSAEVAEVAAVAAVELEACDLMSVLVAMAQVVVLELQAKALGLVSVLPVA